MFILLRREFTVELPVKDAWQHLSRVEEWPSWASSHQAGESPGRKCVEPKFDRDHLFKQRHQVGVHDDRVQPIS